MRILHQGKTQWALDHGTITRIHEVIIDNHNNQFMIEVFNFMLPDILGVINKLIIAELVREMESSFRSITSVTCVPFDWLKYVVNIVRSKEFIDSW